MYRPRIIPCLLLKDKGLVKTIQFKDPTYVGDPINAVKIFNDAKADELVFLDITATNENRPPPLDVIKKIGDEAFMPFAVGGGIKTIEQVREIINAGAEKVVLNSSSIEHPKLITEIAKIFGSQSVICSIDAKKNKNGNYDVYTHSGTINRNKEPTVLAKELEGLGAGEILINSIDRDGCQTGYDIELVKSVAEAVNIPVIACGGAGKLEDFKELIDQTNSSAVAAGSIFVFIGSKRAVLINYPDQEEIEEIFDLL